MIYGRWHHLLSRYNHSLLSPLKNTPSIGRKHRKLTSRPPVLRRRQIAVSNVVDLDATSVSSLMSMPSRHVTEANGVVEQKSSIRKLPEFQSTATLSMGFLLKLRFLLCFLHSRWKSWPLCELQGQQTDQTIEGAEGCIFICHNVIIIELFSPLEKKTIAFIFAKKVFTYCILNTGQTFFKLWLSLSLFRKLSSVP